MEKSIMRSFITKLLIKYRVVVFKKESLEELGSFYINKIHIGLFIFLIFSLSFFVSSLCLFLSPLGNKIFDFSNKQKISDLYLHVDSIENLLSLHLDYTEKLKLIFNDLDTLKQPIDESVVFSIKSLHSRITKKSSLIIEFDSFHNLAITMTSFFNTNKRLSWNLSQKFYHDMKHSTDILNPS